MYKSGKSEILAVGLMSGTSMDGIDAALVRIHGSGPDTRIELLEFVTVPYPDQDRERIRSLARDDRISMNELTRMNARLGILFAEAAQSVVNRAGLDMSQVDLIGSHGQTVRHLPGDVECPSTLQIGDPSYIAQYTGVLTVGDFRPADMAAGGQGAPLVPLFDYLVLRSMERDRAMLNIGGIANVTLVPAGCGPEKVLAFDTGPGNTIVDNLCRTLFDQDFDDQGRLAACGKVHSGIVDIFLKDKYFAKPPPKSTGPEMFNTDKLFEIKKLCGVDKVSDKDLLATATYLTAKTIFDQIRRFSARMPDEIIVSGGGVNNLTLMAHLRSLFAEKTVIPSGDLGIPIDAKEAMCFAVLANETLHGRPGNLPSATGANRPVVLGMVCRP